MSAKEKENQIFSPLPKPLTKKEISTKELEALEQQRKDLEIKKQLILSGEFEKEKRLDDRRDKIIMRLLRKEMITDTKLQKYLYDLLNSKLSNVKERALFDIPSTAPDQDNNKNPS